LSEDSDPGGRVARGSILLFGARIVGNAGFFVAVLVLARGLSIPHRGQFAFITTAAQMTSVLSALGMNSATSVFTAQRQQVRPHLFTNALLWAVGSSLVTSIAVAVAVDNLGSDRPANVTGTQLGLMAAGAVVSSISGAMGAFLSGHGRWRAQSFISAAAPWVYAAILGLLWIGPGLTVDEALITWVVLYGLWSIALFVAAIGRSPLGRPDGTLFKQALRFGVKAWVGGIASILNYRVDQVIMGFIATETALGIYTIAVNASEILLILPSAAGTALMPVLARSEHLSRNARTLRAFRMVTVITLAGMLLAATVGAFLLPYVFGQQYDASVEPFLFLICGTLGFVGYNLFESALLASSAPGLASVAQVLALGVGVGLDFALIPKYGATGAAIAAAVAATTAGLTACLAYRSKTGFSFRELVPRWGDVTAVRNMALRLLGQTRATFQKAFRTLRYS
jgi:O-antigen/teichoic acid export membrane protein